MRIKYAFKFLINSVWSFLNMVIDAKKSRVLFLFKVKLNVFWAIKLLCKNFYFALQCTNFWMTLSLLVTLQCLIFLKVVSRFFQSSCLWSPLCSRFYVQDFILYNNLLNLKGSFVFETVFTVLHPFKSSVILIVVYIQ